MTEQERAEQELVGKNIAWYEKFLGAWIENRMEKDKQVLNLSSLGVGALLILGRNLENEWQLFFWFVGGLGFIIAILLCLIMFSKNSDYIETLIQNNDHTEMEKLEKGLQIKTKWSFRLFLMGVVFTFLLALIQTGYVIQIIKMEV